MKVFNGAKMRAIRKEAGLTQYDLAPMVGISQNRVSDIERNVTAPTVDEIDAFAKALKTQVSAFLSDDTEVEVIENTFTKKKKGANAEPCFSDAVDKVKSSFEKLGKSMNGEQLELFADDTLVGRDLTGYVLVRAEVYKELLEKQQRLLDLQKLLK